MKFQPRLKGVRLLWMTAGILLILVIGSFSKLYFVDTQSLKQTIEQSLSETAELPIHIQSIQFQWARGLGLKINNFTIRSGDGKRIILAAEHILLQPEILPLIYGEFRIKRANVHHPVARIYLDMPVFSPGPEEAFPEMDQPLDSDLTGDSREARAPEKEKSFLASLLDDPEAEAHEISTADAKDESLVESLRSIIRKYHRSIKKINVLDGIVHVIKRHDKKNTADQPIHIDFQIQLQRMGTQRIDATLENVEIQLGNLRVYGTMMAKDVLTSKGILAIDLKSEQFDASELQHILYFMPVDLSRQVRDYPLSGKFDELTVNASIPLDVVDHFEKFNQTMRGRIRLQAKQIATRIGKVRLPIDRWTSDGIWAKGKIHHMIDIATLGGKLSLNGVLKFRKDTKGNELPFIKSKLEIHQLNLAKMKTPSDWGSSRGKITGKINFAGPLFPPKSIRIDGIVNGQNLQVIPEDQPFTVKKAQIQFSTETGR